MVNPSASELSVAGPLNLQSNDFALFGLPERFEQDRATLDQRWKDLQRQVHPDRFAADAATAQRVAIVHGDYRTGNFLEKDGHITAILDWELVHLGDPHEDIGWVSLPMYMGGSPHFCRLTEPEWFYERYSEKAGFQVSMESVKYYRAFSLLKLTATHMAAARCFEEGRFNDMRMPAMGSQIATCLRQLEKTIEAKA